jgi:hypothetical protein
MFDLLDNKPKPKAAPKVRLSVGQRAIDVLYEQERKANMAVLAARRREARKTMDWFEYWPLAVGVAVACFAPQLRELVDIVKPWGMWIVFPLVALAERPELNLSREISSYLVPFMLYAQFPIEGLLAKFALKGRVTVTRVAAQLLFLHSLAVFQLWLVDGPWGGK